MGQNKSRKLDFNSFENKKIKKYIAIVGVIINSTLIFCGLHTTCISPLEKT